MPSHSCNNMPLVAVTGDDMGSSPNPRDKMCRQGVEISWVPATEKFQGCDVSWESKGQSHFGNIMAYYWQTPCSRVQQSA
jgi:hypothetical protein